MESVILAGCLELCGGIEDSSRRGIVRCSRAVFFRRQAGLLGFPLGDFFVGGGHVPLVPQEQGHHEHEARQSVAIHVGVKLGPSHHR